jgi:hypothetical protein
MPNVQQIMLRNIPNKVDQPLLKRIVDASSRGMYDFMYLRIDFANDCKYVHLSTIYLIMANNPVASDMPLLTLSRRSSSSM